MKNSYFEKYQNEIIAITYDFSETNDSELLEELDLASKIHGRYFIQGSVATIPILRMQTEQRPFYVQKTTMPKTESQEIDIEKLRKIIENHTDALIITYRDKNNEAHTYFLPAVVKKEDGTIDPYVRRDSFLPDLKMLNKPEGFSEKEYLELSDIITT